MKKDITHVKYERVEKTDLIEYVSLPDQNKAKIARELGLSRPLIHKLIDTRKVSSTTWARFKSVDGKLALELVGENGILEWGDWWFETKNARHFEWDIGKRVWVEVF